VDLHVGGLWVARATEERTLAKDRSKDLPERRGKSRSLHAEQIRVATLFILDAASRQA
jgi:hypothetical protein